MNWKEGRSSWRCYRKRDLQVELSLIYTKITVLFKCIEEEEEIVQEKPTTSSRASFRVRVNTTEETKKTEEEPAAPALAVYGGGASSASVSFHAEKFESFLEHKVVKEKMASILKEMKRKGKKKMG